jgi:4,5-DOPA dioxygenase extradiol
MSLDYSLVPEKLFAIWQELAKLREKEILIIGSGNIVHNLSRIDWSGTQVYPWAKEFDERVANGILTKNYADILDFHSWGSISELAHPTYDHLLPLFLLLGSVQTDDTPEFYTPEISRWTLSMRSFLWK